MGREYALLDGEDPQVAKGIFEHYLPTGANGALPETEEGAIVSLADKMDSIAGFFGVNLLPTGTADPYALRRQSLGIINIILAKKYPLPLDVLIDRSLHILGGRLKRPAAEVKTDILAFFRSRFENLLLAQGRAYDVVDAVLATPITDLVQAMAKIEPLETVKGDADFEPLAIAFKRVGNISKDFPGGTIDPRLFEDEAENNLYLSYLEVREKAAALIKTGDYRSALRSMALLRKPVDAFFNAVMVMAENEGVKRNRLAILKSITDLFHAIADFSKLNTA
jgi:glycyl-tRNA synthetase beta chain